MVNGERGLFKKNSLLETFERVAITIRWSNPLLPIGVTITLPLEFNFPSRWNPNLGVTRTSHF